MGADVDWVVVRDHDGFRSGLAMPAIHQNKTIRFLIIHQVQANA